MKISSGTKISKGTLARSVKAIKSQDILRNFSKDSSDRGVYVSLSYAPGSGNPTTSEHLGQFIYVTIHNIPRFNGKAELWNVKPKANLYYRQKPNGKIYTHAQGYGEFTATNTTSNANFYAGRDLPSFIFEPKSPRSKNFLRPWVKVDEDGYRGITYEKGYASPHKTDGLFHPKLVTEDWEAAIAGTGSYMQGSPVIDDSLEYKWMGNEKYINVTYPMGIHQSLLPPNGVIGLTNINIVVFYNEFYNGEITGAEPVTLFTRGFSQNIADENGSGIIDYPTADCVAFKIDGLGEYVYTYGIGNIDPQAKVRDEIGYKSRYGKDPLSSINELPSYGDAYYPLLPAQRRYYPWARDGVTQARASVRVTNTPNTPLYDTEQESVYWPVLSRPKLILSEDGTIVEKATIGSWWSKDPKYGRNIGYKHELQVKDKNGINSWRVAIKQNQNFTISNIKSEDLQPVTEDNGVVNTSVTPYQPKPREVDQDYLNYFFQMPTQIRIADYSAIRSKITAKLEIDGEAHYAYMFSQTVYAPSPEQSPAIGYYYYGSEGIGVNNL